MLWHTSETVVQILNVFWVSSFPLSLVWTSLNILIHVLCLPRNIMSLFCDFGLLLIFWETVIWFIDKLYIPENILLVCSISADFFFNQSADILCTISLSDNIFLRNLHPVMLVYIYILTIFYVSMHVKVFF